MVILILIVAASVVAGVVAFDLVKSSRLKKRLASGAAVPEGFDRHSDASTNYAAIQAQANASNTATTFPL